MAIDPDRAARPPAATIVRNGANPEVAMTIAVSDLLTEYDRARAYTDELWRDLSAEEVRWRPHRQASGIGWHLGHQAAVAHFMIRNLTAAEPSPDPPLDAVMDSATPEPARDALPDLGRLADYRDAVADRLHVRIGAILAGQVGAPRQLTMIARTLLVTVINHEYQHDQWIAEVRHSDLGRDLPDPPQSDRLTRLDGYLILNDADA
jgi:DinB superfamily